MIHRKEEHTRCTFAYERGMYWYDKVQYSVKSGNIMKCRAIRKFLQARRIYVHYSQEYQIKENLPLTI